MKFWIYINNILRNLFRKGRLKTNWTTSSVHTWI
jgi:hypothetical protein